MGREPVEKFVVGLPTQPNGEPSENQARVLKFADKLKKALPNIPVEFYDERFTSVLAHRAIIDSGISKKRRQNDKGLWMKLALASFCKTTWRDTRHKLICPTCPLCLIGNFLQKSFFPSILHKP